MPIPWTESQLAELPLSGRVRQRGVDMTRLETFCDAAFAFAVTLLVVGDGIPRSYDELILAMRGIPAFAASFASIAYFWWSHRTWSRRYGLEDSVTTLISLGMIFIMLVYVYPLKMVFTAFAHWASGGFFPTEFVWAEGRAGRDMLGIFTVYGMGFAALNGMMGLLHLRVLKAGQNLALNEVERLITRQGVIQFMVLGATGVASVLWATLMPPNVAIFAGFWYMSLSISMPILGTRHERQVRKLLADED